MSDFVPWLRKLAADGGKGVVNNIDARSLGRIADEIERLRAGLGHLAELTYDEGYSPEDYARAVLAGDEPKMTKPLWELHSALSSLLELTKDLMEETGRTPTPHGAISRAKTMLQIHEAAATEQLRSNP